MNTPLPSPTPTYICQDEPQGNEHKCSLKSLCNTDLEKRTMINQTEGLAALKDAFSMADADWIMNETQLRTTMN